SQVSQSLDDVVKEVVKGTKFEWLLNSKLMEAEMKLDHTKIVNEWEKKSELFYNYITADAYLTLVLAYMWMYTLIFLSSLVQIPLTQLSKLNLGQVSEYNFIHWLEKLGFRVMTAERRKEFRKISGFGFFDKYLDNSIKNLFTKGKVYVKNYGVFENVVEGDFAQLYPSLMSNDTIDPTAIRVSFYVSKDETEPIEFSDPLLRLGYAIGNKTFPVILGYKSKKSADTMVPHDVIEVVPTYGPIAFLIYKMFTMRKITKKLKKRAEVEGRAELMSVDQAVKILNNASYGAFSKRRGFINPVLSSYVFWKTLKIFYDVIDFVERLGATVLYGDTDSIFVKCKEDDAIRMFPDAGSVKEACWRWFTEHIVPQVNKYVKSRYGKELELSPKDIFDVCVYPKSKYSNAPSKKSYICVNKDGDSFKVEVVKGDFFKAMAPDGIKDNMSEFYAEILKNKPKTQEDVIEIAKKLLSELPPHKYFMKKTIDTFESEVLPDTEKTYEFKLKKLNKTFHYAALHILFIQNEKIPEVRESRAIQILSDIVKSNGKSRFVAYIIDAERLLKEKGNVTIYFIPSDTPNKFIVFVDYDEKRDVVIVHGVTIKKVDIVTEKTEGGLMKDVAYRVEETYVEMEIPRTKILINGLESAKKYIIDDVSRKLLPALHSTQFNGFVVQSIGEEDEDEDEEEDEE
ncbi:MAG: DNA polymerase domain-containing protein, partial [Ignisphaera sp.]